MVSSMVDEERQRFEFGNNWYHFIQKNFGPERVRISKKHLLDFIERDDLKGLTFLDIGCGSGLHSVAALEAGAVSVRGFDYDANSVATSRYVQAQLGNPSNWTVEQGSVLDDTFVKNLGTYDLVYSWGFCITPETSGKQFAMPQRALGPVVCFMLLSIQRMLKSTRRRNSGSTLSKSMLRRDG